MGIDKYTVVGGLWNVEYERIPEEYRVKAHYEPAFNFVVYSYVFHKVAVLRPIQVRQLVKKGVVTNIEINANNKFAYPEGIGYENMVKYCVINGVLQPVRQNKQWYLLCRITFKGEVKGYIAINNEGREVRIPLNEIGELQQEFKDLKFEFVNAYIANKGGRLIFVSKKGSVPSVDLLDFKKGAGA